MDQQLVAFGTQHDISYGLVLFFICIITHSRLVSDDCLLHLLVEWFSLRYFQSPSTKGCPYFSVVSGETSKSNSKVHCFLQIIISQERHIQRLNELVRSLQLQLLQCKGENETQNATKSYHINKQFIEVERKQILEG